MEKNFAEHKGLNLVQTNKDVLAAWESNDIFHKTIDEREGAPQFVFFEGPPSANGHPGIHHVMGRTIKDTFLRYKTMKGYQVKRKAGWDTHGLPVELSVEKELGITKEDIGKKISVDEYNDACRRNVMMYTDEWRQLTEQMGYFVDLDNPYITYDNKYIETLWYLLKQLYSKDLLYKGYTIQPYSPCAGTGLSSHELNQPGCYRDVKDTTVTAQFKVKDSVPFAVEGLPTYILAWTTTPWTLPSNTALCVGPKIDYVAVKGNNPYTNEEALYIIAESRLAVYFSPTKDEEGNETPLEILWRGKGTDLVGIHYQQLMPWVKPCALVDDKLVVKEAEAFRVIPGDYVTTEDGTGIVHIAPTFGADDEKVAKDAGIPSLFILDKAGDTRPMVDFQGKYFVEEDMDEEFRKLCVNDSYWHHSGEFVKPGYKAWFQKEQGTSVADAVKALKPEDDLNLVICMEMKADGSAFKIEKHVHNYPHCWRTDMPVLYYPLDSWFIRSTAKKDRMFELNKTINWHPESTGTGRFGKWLENLNDWNLSRSRYWGTPLPIWRNRDTKEEICIGSVEELYNEIEKAVAAGVMTENPFKAKGFVPGDMSKENYDKIDLHRPYVDYIKLVGKDGSVLTRELDLIDVWFDSGAMPYAQIHYPFENADIIDKKDAYPADFIAEGVDQTRGWFFTLHAIGTMVFDSVAFKNVISNGLVLDKKGIKMSKRLGNVINPFECIGTYGADAVRWYMVTNSSPWDNLSFDPDGVKEVTGSFFVKLFQAYSFFTLYANVDGFTYSEADVPFAERPDFDRWLLSELNTLVKGVDKNLADYDVTPAGRLIQNFVIDKLSNWYIRLNKKRFWGGGMTQDKLSAYQTLYTCIDTIARLIAPVSPFYSDQLFLDLNKVTGKDTAESIHLAKFPEANEEYIDTELEQAMQVAMQVTSMVLSLRKKVKIPVIQALQTISIPASDKQLRERIERMAAVILAETNVKELQFIEDGTGMQLVKKVKCNFRTMGKKFGKLMKDVNNAVMAMSQEQIAELEANGSIALVAGGENVTIEAADVEIISEDIPGWTLAQEGKVTVALDIEITPELKNEGVARLIIKRIQALRKDSGFEITDRISVVIEDKPELTEAVRVFGDHISAQVLANTITLGAVTDGVEAEFSDFTAKIKITKE